MQVWWTAAAGTWLLPLTGHLWSLAIEEQFYLAWPIIILFIRGRRKLVWTALSLSLFSLFPRHIMVRYGASPAALYHDTFCRADSLLGGAWLSLMVRGRSRERVLRFAMPCFWLGLACCLLIASRQGNFDWETNRSLRDYGFSVLAFTNVSFIAMALKHGSFAAKALQTPFLRFFGKYSYGLYVNLPMGVIASRYAVPFLRVHLQSRAMFHFAQLTVVLALTIPAALLSFYLYETPFLRLKRYFNYGPRQVVATTAGAYRTEEKALK